MDAKQVSWVVTVGLAVEAPCEGSPQACCEREVITVRHMHVLSLLRVMNKLEGWVRCHLLLAASCKHNAHELWVGILGKGVSLAAVRSYRVASFENV